MMANENDKKIKDLLAAIDKKRKALGIKPKFHLKTNGIIAGTNINTVNSIDKCIALAAGLLQEKSSIDAARQYLGIPEEKNDEFSTTITNGLEDLKLRVQVINWEVEKKKLQGMENKLKDLRSNDAKTEDALNDLASLLEK